MTDIDLNWVFSMSYLDENCITCEYAKEYGFDETYILYCSLHTDKHEITDDESSTIPSWCPRRQLI